MDLQSVTNAYFDADRQHDVTAVEAAFSGNASVLDEGTRHDGTAAIRRWWTATKDKYQHVAVPTQTVIAGDKVLVKAIVTGRFSGSPATLDYAFTVKQGKIVSLEIG